MSKVDISTRLKFKSYPALELQNPVMAASGTFGYGQDMVDFFDPAILGGIATKGISLEPREGNPPIRICETASGMLNAIGLNNVGFEAFVENKMPFLRKLEKTACLVNFYGNCIEDYAKLAEKLSAVEGVDALEMNISCPNVKEGGIVFGSDPVIMSEVVSAAREKCTKPLIVKLSPNVTSISKMAEVAVNAGADGLSLINTLTGMAIDINSKRPVLANVIGGLSGPAIKPVALKMTFEVCKAVDVPVIAMGGISTAEDVLEFLLAGASAVQVGTASFTNPNAMQEMIKGIADILEAKEVSSVEDWIGSLII